MSHRKFPPCFAILLIASIICLLCLPLQISLKANSKQNPQTLRVETSFNSPIEITDIRLNGASIKSQAQSVLKHSRFEWQDIKIDSTFDWMKNLEIDFKNISNKDIQYVSGELCLEHSLLEYPVIVYIVSEKSPSFIFKPNTSLVLKTFDKSYFYADVLLKSQNPSAVFSNATLKVGDVGFTDNTKWVTGTYLKPDPLEPRKWIPDPQPPQEQK